MLSVAIVEDDEKDAKTLTSALMRYGKENSEEFRLKRFENAEKFLLDYRPVYDVVFMDIELSGTMDGLNAAKRMRRYDEDVALLFVTNMAQFAVKGYEVSALDYFIKPISYYDLKMRMDRIRRTRRKSGVSINIPIDGGVRKVFSDDIHYIEVNNHTLYYHTVGGTLSARGSINEAEKALSASGFARCSISYLVNLRHCTEIRGGTVKVGGDDLRITRGKHKEFLYKLAETLNGGGY